MSKFFHGGHALDNNSNNPKASTPKHQHSNIARHIVKDLAIAVFARKEATPNYTGFIVHAQTHIINEHTATYTFKLLKQKEDSANDQYLQISPYYRDFEYFGKHYLIGATKTGQGADVQTSYTSEIVRRHYTISNCMQKQFYDLLLKAANEYLNDKDPAITLPYDYLDTLSQKKGSEVNMTIKNY